MSQYRFEIHAASGRHNSTGCVAKSAYINREQYFDERNEKSTTDYSKRHDEELRWSGVFVDPKCNAPDWVNRPEEFWNRASKAEKRKDGLECQDAVGNLPFELTPEENRRWVTDFVREEFTRGTGRVVNVAFHAPSKTSDDRNEHCHIMWSMRAVGPDGFADTKFPSTGPRRVEELRLRWAEHGARALEKAALTREGEDREYLKLEAERWRVGHMTLEKQRDDARKRKDWKHYYDLDREAQEHEGPKVRGLEADGIPTRKRAKNDEKKMRNYARQQENDFGRANDADLRDAARQDAYDKANPPRENPWQNARDDIRQTWSKWMIDKGNLADLTRFQRELEDGGYLFCRVTKDEAALSAERHEAASKIGKYAPKFRAGEYVVMDENQRLFRLTPDTTGKTFKEINDFMKPLDKGPIQSISDASKLMHQCAAEFQKRQEMFGRINDPTATRKAPAMPRSGRADFEVNLPSMGGLNRAAERLAGLGLRFNAASRTAGKVLDLPGKILDGLLAPILSPEQKAEGREADREKEARAAQAQHQRGWETETAEQERQRRERNSGRDR